MGLLDVLFGRSRRVPPSLDALFRLPSAAVTLSASVGLSFSGKAGACMRGASSLAFEDAVSEAKALLQETGRYESYTDEYGFYWLVVECSDVEAAVTAIHAVNSSIKDSGWGDKLLCSVFPFVRDPAWGGADVIEKAYLVYLYKEGGFYPFVPKSGSDPRRPERDTVAELKLKAVLEEDLPLVADLTRWNPLWGLPF
jgi:hypothetical protein